MEFQKEEFANLLKSAKGKRSINKYGQDSSVDPGYISRLLRCLIETPPSAMVINKLGEKAVNGVTTSILLKAAGYLTYDIEEERIRTMDEKKQAIRERSERISKILEGLPEEKQDEYLELIEFLAKKHSDKK